MASLLATAPFFHAIMKHRTGGVIVAGAVRVVVAGEYGVAAYALTPQRRGGGGALLRLRRHRDASLSSELALESQIGRAHV